MNRRAFVTGLGVSLAIAPGAVAQQAGKIARIGVVAPVDQAPQANVSLVKFRAGLRELGYIEGQSIIVEYRWSQGQPERLAANVSELIRLPVDVLVVGVTGAALAARKESTTIPIVSASAGALVESGLAVSLARPGGNVTGLTGLSPELSGKRLDLLKEVVPKLSRVALLSGASTRPALTDIFVKQTETAARAKGINIHFLQIQAASEFEGAFEDAVKGGAVAAILLPNPFFTVHAERVAALALRHRLATITGDPGVVEVGGLMRYGPDYPDMWWRAAGYVDKILKGANPADLPIEQPTKFELVINLKTAKALGLTIPPSLLLRADQVLE